MGRPDDGSVGFQPENVAQCLRVFQKIGGLWMR